MKTVIKKWGINGEGIAYLNRKPVFIEGAIPNEVVNYEVIEERENFCVGKLQDVLEESSSRRFPICPLWKDCGGCSLAHVKYKAQCKMKEQVLKEALKKYARYTGKVESFVKNPTPLAYRNACKLPFGSKNGMLVTGMYQKNSNDFVAIDRCLIHSKQIERVRKEVLEILNEFRCCPYSSKFNTGFRTLVIKEFNEKIQVILVTAKQDISKKLIDRLCAIEGVVSLWQSVKIKDSVDVFGKKMVHLGLDKNIYLDLDNFKLSLLPRSFFQLNTLQAINMYKLISDLVPSSKMLVEAYSGIGAISLFLKDKAKKIVGIEYVQDAVENANENARINDAKNVSFIQGDAGSKLAELSKTNDIDSLVVDPPRSGLDALMKKTILSSNIKTIVYVSCNPSTLAKDLGILQKKYKIKKVYAFDVFSQTQHVESIVLLQKK